jgi:hypothetical protein
MNAINMPGFTADESLYRTNASYPSIAKVYMDGEQQVIAQLDTGPSGFLDIAKGLLRASCKGLCALGGIALADKCNPGGILVSSPVATAACKLAAASAAASCVEGCSSTFS